MNGASAALCVSDIPFAGPIGAVRVGRVDGEFDRQPDPQPARGERSRPRLRRQQDEVIMIEGDADELPEDEFNKALHFAQKAIRAAGRRPGRTGRQVGQGKTRRRTQCGAAKELLEIAYEVAGDRIEDAIYKPSKVERGKAVDALRDEVEAAIKEKLSRTRPTSRSSRPSSTSRRRRSASPSWRRERAATAATSATSARFRGETNLLPRVHGSALFARGETQALAIATLAPLDETAVLRQLRRWRGQQALHPALQLPAVLGR